MAILETPAPIPVTVIGGFLGAGKTTLINHLIASADGVRLGVLVNDFGAINIDERLIVGVAEGVVELKNGCLCCTIRNDVAGALFRLLERKDRPEHIMVETSGVSDPGAVVEMFIEIQRLGAIRFDGTVIVVDAAEWPGLSPENKALADWQVRAADLVLLNKVDLVAPSSLVEVCRALRERAPGARLMEVSEGRAPLDAVLGLERQAHPETHVCNPDCEHADSPGVAHGFASFTVTSPAPFDFRRLVPAMTALPTAIYRAKGLVALRERPGDQLILHMVGRRIHVRTLANDVAPFASQLVFIGRAGAFDPAELTARIIETTG